jgi:hypothetical protein
METTTLEKNPNIGLTPELVNEWLSSTAGQSAMRKMQSARRPAHTAKEIEKFTRMAENGADIKYIRTDPKTLKPFEEAKDFFWRIISFVPDCVGINVDVEYLEGDLRISFLIQKFHRDEKLMYETNLIVSDTTSSKRRVHAAYVKRRKDGSLSEPGDRLIDASDFMEQFKREESAE